jgi:DNA-directed RNA polymerase
MKGKSNLLHSRRDFLNRPPQWPKEWPLPTIEDQIRLEEEMVREGVARFDKMKNELIEKKREGRTKHGRTLVASLVDKVAEGVREIIETPTCGRDITRKKLLKADPEKVAYLSLITVVDYLGSKMPLTGVAKRVGQFIEDQLLIEAWVEQDKDHAIRRVTELAEKTLTGRYRSSQSLKYYARTTEEFEDAEQHFWTNRECIHVGVRLIDNIIRTTGIIKLKLVPISRGKTQNFIEPTEETLEWVKRFNEFHEGAKPRFAPCIIEPRDWVSPFDGGYYSDLNNKIKLVKKY